MVFFLNPGLQEIRRWCSKPPLLGNIVRIGDKSGYLIYQSINQTKYRSMEVIFWIISIRKGS